MTFGHKLTRSRKAVQQMEELVLAVLMQYTKQGTINEAEGLHPHQIGKELPALVIEPFPPHQSKYSIIYGILDSLAREGRIARADNGGVYMVDPV
ncbi:MAG: hypothetical protein OXG26_19620 [Caldilineaceae bacterium]|nr:hypothetical protein [Caldilineaceae bacterium]